MNNEISDCFQADEDNTTKTSENSCLNEKHYTIKTQQLSFSQQIRTLFSSIKNTKKLLILISIILILALLTTYLWYCQNALEIENYNIKTNKIKSSVKIAFISDLHHKEFGQNNTRLVNKINDQEPDLILIGGDMVSNSDTKHDIVITLVEQLVNIAPTYYALGNHEKRYVNLEQLIVDIKNTGAIFLDNEYTYFSGFEMNGEEIVIGGLSDYPYYEQYYPDFETKERFFLDEFRSLNEDNFCVLLGHQPEFYMWKLKDFEIDLILSGHTHGGVIQIPFIGGVYSPTEKFFPEYDEGYFSSGTAQMIITSGLSISSPPVPRINNNPEVCIVNIN